MNPAYRKVLATYAAGRGIEVREVGFCMKRGLTSLSLLDGKLDDVACLIVQSPNYFGIVEDMPALADAVHKSGGLFVSVVNPISLGLLAPPGECGADIAVGEGQPLGIPMSFGGPLLGFFATTSKLLRKMPGRLVGQTVDSKGAVASFSRCRHASSTSGARTPPATSALTKRCARWLQPYISA